MVGLLSKGYRVVALGYHSVGVNERFTPDVNTSKTGASARRVYFVVDRAVGRPRTMRDIGFVDVDLNESELTHVDSWAMPGDSWAWPRWSKLRVETRYPFEAYIYIPGSGMVDGTSVEVHESEFLDVCSKFPVGWSVGYRLLHRPSHGGTDLLLKATDFQQGAVDESVDPDKMVVYVQHRLLGAPVEAVLLL